MTRKILISDYDGTFFTSEPSLEQNIKAVETWRTAGNLFVIATARSLTSVEGRNLIDGQKICDYIALNNGAIVLDGAGSIISEHTISPASAQKIIDFANKASTVNINISSYNTSGQINDQADQLTKIRIRPQGKSHEPTENLAAKLYNRFGEAFQILITYNDYYPMSNDHIIDIVSKSAGKESAIDLILTRENLPKSAAITIGDGPNDLNMLRNYKGYAMQTADSSVLQQIPRTTPSVATLISNMLQ